MNASVIQQRTLEQKIVRRNTLLFILSRLDFTAMIVPVIVKIWGQAGLSFSEMLFLQGIFALVIVLSEIPSGAISDTFKRKYVLITGYMLISIAVLIYYFGNSFTIFAIAEGIFGIGAATVSGSDSGLLYDSLVNAKEEKKYKKIFGRASTFSFITATLSLIVSGFIATYSLRLPLLIIAVSFCFRALLCALMIEPKRTKAKSVKKATISSLKLLFRSKILIAVLLAVLSNSVAQRVVFWAYQPKLFDNGITPFQIGLIFASMNLVAALGSTVFPKISEKHEDTLLLGFLILETLNIFIIWHFDSLIIITAMMAVQLSRGGRMPIISAIIQRKASSDSRATLVSLYSSIGSLVYFPISLIFTLYNVSLDNSLMIMLPFSIILTVLFTVLVWTNHNGKGKKQEI
ncbi:MAG: MFS transporter [Candidatus Heimdallarchaeota archaeon]|nr:MFS transporter [Candidatus Heimdallarchaeota archaeon]